MKNANELLDDEDELDENGRPISYDEKLARIKDVSTLTRAQRRARARHIMKQQRKEDSNVAVQQQQDDNNDEPPVQDIPPMNENNNNNHQTHHNLRHLSRKERTERAKQKEREERRAQESLRRREQQKVEDMLHQQKMEKDRQKAIKAEKQRQQRIQQRETDELLAYQKWRTFLPIIKDDTLGTTTIRDDGVEDNDNNVLTVQECIKELNEHDKINDGSNRTTKIVTISSLSKRCGVPPEQVRSRIHELLVSGRVTGILEEGKDDPTTTAAPSDECVANSSTNGTKTENEEDFHDGYFIYVPRNILSVLASEIEKQDDKVTLKDIQQLCRDHLFSSSNPRNS